MKVTVIARNVVAVLLLAGAFHANAQFLSVAGRIEVKHAEEKRAAARRAAHIKAWRSPFRNRATNYVIRNNAMCFGQDVLIQACSGLKNLDGSSSLPTLEGNVFVGRTGDLFGTISETSGKSLTYGPDTQAFVDTFGKGNRCYFK